MVLALCINVAVCGVGVRLYRAANLRQRSMRDGSSTKLWSWSTDMVLLRMASKPLNGSRRCSARCSARCSVVICVPVAMSVSRVSVGILRAMALILKSRRGRSCSMVGMMVICGCPPDVGKVSVRGVVMSILRVLLPSL